MPRMADVLRGKETDPDVAYRYGNLPLVEDAQGAIHMGWPQTAIDLKHAAGKMGRALRSAFGASYAPQDVMPTNQDAALIAGLAMTGGGFGGGLASKAVSGRALAASGGDRLSLRSSPVATAETGPYSGRVYRGAGQAEQWPHPTNDLGGWPPHFWSSDNPETAGAYVHGDAPQMMPADVNFKNAMIVDAGGAGYPEINWRGQHTTADAILNDAMREGHDGLVVRNLRDGGPPSNPGGVPTSSTVAAISPNTVRSATTGETLFSNPKEAAPLGLLAAENNNPNIMRGYHGTGADFNAFDPNYFGSRSEYRDAGTPPTPKSEKAFFFSDTPELANKYATDRISSIPHEEMKAAIEKGEIPPDAEHNFTRYDMAAIDAEKQKLFAKYFESGARVIPGDIDTTGFKPVNMMGYEWMKDEGAKLRKQIAQAKKEGHRGLIVDNMADASGRKDRQILTWTQGTVKSPYDGSTLFSNPKEAAPVGMVAGDTQRRPTLADILRQN